MKTTILKLGFIVSGVCMGFASCSPPPTPTPTKPNVEKTTAKDSITSLLNKEPSIVKDLTAEVPKPKVISTKKKETPDTTTHPISHNIVAAPEHKSLTLIIKGLKSASAPIVVGVYGPNNRFLDENDQMKVYKFTPHDMQLQTQINDLDYGELAMALYQDVDNDGKMTKNLIGMPTEPYAFSNNYHPSIRAPKFKECEFTYNASTNTVVVSMIK